MNIIKSLLLITGSLFLFISCNLFNEKTDDLHLTFSSDTIMFDTIFTRLGSTTKQLKVYNNSSENINIESIHLGKGNNSYFRLNIDGKSTNSASNITIKSQDSMYIFIEVTIDPLNSNSPMLVEDSLLFVTKNNIQDVNLVAWGQDVNLYIYDTLKTSKTWKNNKPYFIYYAVIVDSMQTLTIEEGTKICFYKYGTLWVDGTLIVKGTKENPVIFQGSRFDDLLPKISYDDVPGQWRQIQFSEYSKNNRIDYAIIKNAGVGIQIGMPQYKNHPDLILSNTTIINSEYIGLYCFNAQVEAYNLVVANTGWSAIALGAGGNYNFYHCTVSNLTTPIFLSRQDPSFIFTNFYKGYYFNIQKYQYEIGYFKNDLNLFVGNSIIYGNLDFELGYADTSEAEFNYIFDHCIIKAKKPENVSDTNHFKNIIFKVDSLFLNEKKKNFRLDTLSTAQDKGSLNIATKYPLDYDGNNRLADGLPDLGAFEKNK